MSARLFFSALLKFLLGVVLVGMLIFLPAGSLCYIQGWMLMGALFLPMLGAGIVMMIKSPELLQKRLDGKEDREAQGLVVKLCGLMFISGFIIAGLGFRFGWYILPTYVSLVATGVLLLAYLLYAAVLRENAYLSRRIEVSDSQTVVDTGPYKIVRHPMYSATLLLFLAMPAVLGSVYSLAVFLVYPFLISFRIKDEESLLCAELEGYEEYKEKVRYKLIPYIY